MLSEAQIEKKVTDYAKKQGWLAYKFTSPGNRAVPDRIYLKAGTVLFIEFKAAGQKPSALQKLTHEKFSEQGFLVSVVDDVERGKAVIDAAA